MADIDSIKSMLESIRQRRRLWKLSRRRKNQQTLSALGIEDDELAFDTIYDHLKYQNYISGPELDNHTPIVPGVIWVFGLNINGEDCYLKFQDKPSGAVIWISLHIAEYPMVFPYSRG
ncbi:hypothetical protein [Secundilactobacillus yichangensis]|uniref:hypothetical protein n=1 Tax=Secundilactobacillus yichangensis TaxID=2799580 RepID=UPI001944EB7A|nr:hypothetical protein [Secundilactobacillus yichangensis]